MNRHVPKLAASFASVWRKSCLTHPKAFFNLPKTPLYQLSRLLGLSLNAADPLIDIIKGLVLHCFPKMDGELLRILKQRTVFGDQMQDFLELLERQDLATADDEKDIAAVKQTWKQTKQDVEEFTKQYVEHEKTTTRTKNRTLKSKSGKAFPKQLPAQDDLRSWQTVLLVREYLPPDESTVFCDTANGRWQLSRSTASLEPPDGV